MVFGKKEKEQPETLDLPTFPEYESKLPSSFSINHPKEKLEIPKMRPVMQGDVQRDGRQLFIKIDKYREARKALDKIKEDVADVDKIVEKLEALKSQEDQELEQWQSDMKKLKDRLIRIDSILGNE